MITIFYLALGSSRQVSHSLLASGLKLSFRSDQSHLSQCLTNFLQVNPSDTPHVKKSSKKDADPLYPELPREWQDLNFPDEEFLQPTITKQGAAEAEKRSPSAHRASSVTADHIRPSRTRDLELEICLTEAQNQKMTLELDVLRPHQADGSADENTTNSLTQPTAKKNTEKNSGLAARNSPQGTFPLPITIN